jgi:hypothetical protein
VKTPGSKKLGLDLAPILSRGRGLEDKKTKGVPFQRISKSLGD